MNAPARPLADVTERALRVLAREIGVADTARFLQQFGAGAGDYTKERDALFGHLTLGDVVDGARQHALAPDDDPQ